MYCGYAVTVDINSNDPHTLKGANKNKNKKEKVWITLMRLGAMTGCHQMYERSLFFRGYQFPLCARCTGLFTGQAAGIALLWWFIAFDIKILFVCTALSVAALGIDGFFQLKGLWVSTNSRRLITGLLCGFFVTGLSIRIIAIAIKHFFLYA
jgi:uncharacterized membrane protein